GTGEQMRVRCRGHGTGYTRCCPRRVRLGGVLRQTKIENFRLAAARDENIRRLDIAMDNTVGVRGIQRVGNLHRELQHLVQPHRLAFDAMLQRLPSMYSMTM